MTYLQNKIKTGLLGMTAAVAVLSACNKGVEPVGDLPVTPTPSGQTIAQTLAATPTDSLYNKLVVKAGLNAVLGNASASYTLFVPDNAAVIASFGGSLASANATINALPAATAGAIVQYNTLPQRLTSAQIVHPFPNMQLPTNIILDPTNPLVRMTAFPSKNPSTNIAYFNTAPLTAVDALAANGVIHHTAFVVAPPSRVLKDTLNRNPNLTLFMATVLRGDSGQVGTNRFDSLLNFPVTNMTVLAPDNNAVKTLIFGLSGGLVPLAAPDAVFIAFINNNIPVALARGIIAYHLIAKENPLANNAIQPGIRVFSTNIPNTPTFIKTLVNSSVATHPGVRASVTFTGPFATTFTFTGLGTFPSGGAPYSGTPANVTGPDRLAVNGVVHVIDRVLLPQ